MIYTRICDLLRIEPPILLDGLGTATSPALVAAVSDAGGFGTQSTSGLSAAQITSDVKAIREATDRQPNRRTLGSVCPPSMTITRFLCGSPHTMMCAMSADDRHLPLSYRDCERLLWVGSVSSPDQDADLQYSTDIKVRSPLDC